MDISSTTRFPERTAIGRFHACAALAVSLTGLLAASISAATFHVSSMFDRPDAVAGDGACEATPGSGDCTLRAAVQETNALRGPDVIEIPEGTVVLGIPGRYEEAGASGDLDVLGSLVVRGAGAGVTVVDAAGLDRIFDVPTSHGEARVELLGLTLRGGSAGAVRFLGPGALVVRGCALEDNRSAAIGGAVYAVGAAVVIEDSRLTGNWAQMQGGAIRVHRGSLELLGGEISGNASGGRGGGLDVTLAETRVTRTVIRDNAAQQSGGSSADALTRLASVTVRRDVPSEVEPREIGPKPPRR